MFRQYKGFYSRWGTPRPFYGLLAPAKGSFEFTASPLTEAKSQGVFGDIGDTTFGQLPRNSPYPSLLYKRLCHKAFDLHVLKWTIDLTCGIQAAFHIPLE